LAALSAALLVIDRGTGRRKALAAEIAGRGIAVLVYSVRA
jgi:hypothetical protein